MGFSERTRTEAKQRSAFRCCVCRKPFVEVHHLVPQLEGGDDSIENAAPLCSSCHDLYGGNPEKRKALRQMRNYWWELIGERRKRFVDQADATHDSDFLNESVDSTSVLRTQSVSIYHVIFESESFDTAAMTLFKLIRSAQETQPNQPRRLFLDIEGHRTKSGAFDHDTFELQQNFLLEFLMPYLSELYMPLIHVHNTKLQRNDLPDSLNLIPSLNQSAINKAIDSGVDGIWVADKAKFMKFE